ncbi:hypothetical protein EZI54_11390 [Marinobacter halodurans]|uniref:Roadblock/LC7 domain-containing protein n=1 Tax=Marinobacter halodurans TaxID=2528979 RepID=A0ABY1ZM47_9GAMM|nr:hypothetical protein [Marinobacter halodurans]TBW55425.1 hypothetical protein EZI54_11390 [Marinobacter halodurans]
MSEQAVFNKDIYVRATRKLMTRRLTVLDGESVALLATADGRLCVSTCESQEEATSRQAAFSSALMSLSQRFCQEVLGSQNGEIALSCLKGNAVIVRLELGGKPYQLCVASGEQNNLATVIRIARDMGEMMTNLPHDTHRYT